MLTVVVPTIPGRESLLSRCLWSLTSQPDPVSILVIEGAAGLGAKLTVAWWEEVDTPYVAAVDDDDYVTPDYTAQVLPLLDNVDYVGFQFLELTDGWFNNISASKGDYPAWGARTRGPSPKCPTRVGLARKVKFGDDYKADRRWSAGVHELVESCDFIPSCLYVHDWWGGTSSFHNGEHRMVGEWPYDESKVRRIKVDGAGQ